MSLAIGTRLGPYEVLGDLGSGGMGEVYKARDTRLDRIVAVKVLPAGMAANPERKRRFVQEAKAASALNHPNTVTIYDIANDNGIDLIVMEYVRGKSLDQLIPRKGLRTAETLKYAIQIADAMAKAHAAGIVHRDLKPGNIMVSEEGQVKVLDFGLAKLMEASVGEDAPTMTTLDGTEAGTILGTISYMSPEQAEGKPLDARSDIFSFGGVLYEMVTGQKAFHGDSKLSTLSAILREDPKPIGQIVTDIPPDLEKIIQRCLRKDPERRFQHMADMKVALQEAKEESDSGSSSRTAAVHKPGRRNSIWIAALAGVVVLCAAAIYFWRLLGLAPPRDAVPMRLTLLMPEKKHISGLPFVPNFAVSPDGRSIVFAAGGSGDWAIYLRSFSSDTSQRLEGTEHAQHPFWSPDGSAIGFISRNKLKTVSVHGRNGRVLCDATKSFGATWSKDGTILFSSDFVLYRIPGGGGQRTQVTQQDHSRGDFRHAWPQLLPDGRRFLFFIVADDHPKSGVYLGSLDGSSPQLLFLNRTHAKFAAPDLLVYVSDSNFEPTLVAQPWDLVNRRIIGAPREITKGVNTFSISAAAFSLSENGVLASATADWAGDGPARVNAASSERRGWWT